MRGVLAGLLVALVIAVLALFIAFLGALGVAAIGWLLQRWFGLTQWQGSLIALAMMFGMGYVLYKISIQPAYPTVLGSDWDEWEEDEEEEEEEEEPPIVPWRRSRPTPGELPAQKPASTPPTTRGKRK